MLAANLIHEFLQEQVPVLYFFFRQIVDANHKPRAALQDWLAQALTYSPPLQLELKSYLGGSNGSWEQQKSSQPRELDSISTVDLWQHLRTALSHFSRAYIVVDALDEMDQGLDMDSFLHYLSDLANWRPSQIKILTTSRPSTSVERLLPKRGLLRLRLEGENVDHDISAYVQSRLDASTIPLELHGHIQAAVPGKAKGLFLYAKLAMDALLKESVNLETALREIPENLHHMYVQLLDEHAAKSGISREMQLLLMQWITHSVRPLRLIEMSDMIINEPLFDNEELGAAKRLVRSACGQLLELLPDETLCVVHHSLTEFLKGDTRTNSEDYPILGPGPAHHQLALICLSYLQNGCLEWAKQEALSPHRLLPRISAETLLAPFTRYAAINWGTHVKRSAEYGVDQTQINIMLDEFVAHAHFQKWAHLAGLRIDANCLITPMFMAIVLGLPKYLQHLLAKSDTDVNAGAPIVWAADKGFADVVDVLIQSGADVDQYDAKGYTALHCSALKNHPKVVRLLLRASCSMNQLTKVRCIDGRFQRTQHSALWYACKYGHHEVVAEFQPHMKTPKEVEYALTMAVKCKRAEIVRHLLQHPLADLNKPEASSEEFEVLEEFNKLDMTKKQSKLLNLACSNRDLDTIELLLAAGADVNTYALHALAHSKEAIEPESLMRCFALLIKAGADLNMPERSQYYNTPLHQVADIVAAKILLNAGANVEAENKGKETPLHTCDDVGILTVLIKAGNANLEKTNYSGQTPLLAAISNICIARKNLEVILALIDHGADVNAVDKEGNGVFHFAIKKYRHEFPEGLIARLCAAGADINRPNNWGEAPIHLTKIEISKAFQFFNLNFPKKTTRFEILVAAGARLSRTTANVSRTPLFKWVNESLCDANETDLPEILATLVQYGAPLDITDDQGRTLLHEAAKGVRHKAQIQFLLENGLDPKATDKEGSTLWHEAASSLASALYNLADGPAEPFHQLTLIRIDPTQPNYYGRTPLHVLSSLWPGSVYDFKRSSGCGIGSGHLNYTTAFDVVLSLHPNVNIVDNDAVTPLHLASTFSEYLVERLLEKGADPSCVTKEGCNAIHLAARSRMPNIVGLLLEHLRSRSITTYETSVNAKDHLGRAPLYYACIAGSYESAKLLVDAGAIIDSSHYGSSAWKAIAELETEIQNWSSHSRDKSAGAVLMADKHRPSGQGGYYRNGRIDELIALLVASEARVMPFMDQAIADAASAAADHTVECLLRARSSLQLQSGLEATTSILASVERTRIEREGLEKPCTNCKKMHHESPLHRVRIMHDYHLLPKILMRFQSLSNTKEGKALLHDIVSNGFASVLQHLTMVGGLEALDDRVWNGQRTKNASGTYSRQDEEEPLLVRACRREVSNIDVIRVLVEQASHDVNAHQHVQEQTESYYQGFSDFGRYVEGESALHALVRGEHWWHVSEGLRYLLERGADTEFRDIHGMTPLSAALNRCGWLIFNKRAVELLVQHGADVNAVDRSGNSCLAKACSDMEMTKLLLEHGAVVTQCALNQAINLKDVGLLALLLSHGADPNAYGKVKRPGWTKVSPNDYSPLRYVLYAMGKTSSDYEKYKSMAKLLLDHGATPCAKHDDTTILHELVSDNEDINVLFMAPEHNFNLEVRNASGETPLLTACHRTSSPDMTMKHNAEGRSTIGLLIQHGASIRARDDNCNNILHLFAKNNAYGSLFEDFVGIVKKAPELIDQPNNEGATPLLIAMEQPLYSRIIDTFLENGGNVGAVDKKGNSILHVLLRSEWNVSERGKIEGKLLNYFNLVLALDVDINVQNKEGETPVYSFFRHGRVRLNGKSMRFPGPIERPVYELFTKFGIDWQVINKRGQNLLHIVASAPSITDPLFYQKLHSSPSEKFKTLLELGLDAALEDETGRTPLDVAADLGHKEILELFHDR